MTATVDPRTGTWAASWAICSHGAYADLCITCVPKYRSQPTHSLTVTRPLAQRRRSRRVKLVLDYVDDHPESTTYNDPALHRLDVLLGEAEALWRRLP